MTEYKSFQISPCLVIYKDGREMPRSWWHHATTIEDCQRAIDAAIAAQIRQQKAQSEYKHTSQAPDTDLHDEFSELQEHKEAEAVNNYFENEMNSTSL